MTSSAATKQTAHELAKAVATGFLILLGTGVALFCSGAAYQWWTPRQGGVRPPDAVPAASGGSARGAAPVLEDLTQPACDHRLIGRDLMHVVASARSRDHAGM